MIAKKFQYKDIDGDHWPDASLGEALYYSIDYAQWIVGENDTFISATWIIPTGITGTDSFEEGGEAFIKLEPAYVGSFKVVLKLVTTENNREQTKAIPIILRVL